MAITKPATFDEIVKLAGDFVTQQKGAWDHSAWLDFLSTVQKRGVELSEEMQAYLGELLEAMKRFYQSTASTRGIEQALAKVTTESVDFVKAHKAVWNHSDWEDFARQVQKNTSSLTEETTSYLGGILESVKAFYAMLPLIATPSKVKTATAKKPTAAKAASTPKKVPAPKVQAAEDDLTAITGIGPALQKKLKAQGIRSFAEIAALSDADIQRLEDTIIKFPGRIKRDDWVGQARRLSGQTA